jgi:prepilin-type N-terminal cleavage/methylation domain-containing protein
MNSVSKQKMLAIPKNRFLSKKNVSTAQGGFTLIEIAIVLVIIGLLLGGVLKGQELINTARVRALNNSVDGITAAWFSFQDRYRAFPGDYATAQSNLNLPGAPDGGDANGQIDTPAEAGRLWVHLEAAGYITGGYSDDTVTIALDEYASSVTDSPDNGFGSGMVVSLGSEIYNGGVAAVAAHELISGRGIPVEVLAELDRKIDDGAADSGAMQLGNGDGDSWSGTAACLNGSAYQLQTPSSNCAAVFRNF